MPTSRDKYGPCFFQGENFERMHVVRVEGSNKDADKSKGVVQPACAVPLKAGAHLNILRGNYIHVKKYFEENGATVNQDIWNFNDAETVKNQLRWQLQVPPWSDDAKEYPRTINFNRTVYVAGRGGRSLSLADRAAGKAACVQIGTDKGVLGLDDVLGPIADAPDRWKTFSDRSGEEAWMQAWARRGAWNGLLTIIVDACCSGAWIKDMIAKINGDDPIVQKIQGNRAKEGGCLWISFRVSSLSREFSWYDEDGGMYTKSILQKLESQDGSKGCGYGTMAFIEDEVNGNDVVWTAYECSCEKTHYKLNGESIYHCSEHPQTDIAVDFRLDANGWRWWFPESRGAYIKWD